MVKKDYVLFMSAGTFCSEQSSKEIEGWDVDKAVVMAKKICERYDSHPYGFQFITKGREDNELDSKIIKKSGTYYLNGVVETLEQVKAKGNPDDRILIQNMECNHWDKIVTTYNPYKWTQPLNKNDVVLTVK